MVDEQGKEATSPISGPFSHFFVVKCPAVICIDCQIVWQRAQPRPSGGEETHDSAARRKPGRLVIDGSGQSKARDKTGGRGVSEFFWSEKLWRAQ